MADSSKTKKQLMDQVDELKKELSTYKKNKKDNTEASKDMEELAFSVTKMGANDFRLVIIKYNIESGAAVVHDTIKVEPNVPHMVAYQFKKEALNYITNKVLT
jgi:hypothetical protein